MEWSEEVDLITIQANYFGVDPLWIETIRKVENGGPAEVSIKQAYSVVRHDAQFAILEQGSRWILKPVLSAPDLYQLIVSGKPALGATALGFVANVLVLFAENPTTETLLNIENGNVTNIEIIETNTSPAPANGVAHIQIKFTLRTSVDTSSPSVIVLSGLSFARAAVVDYATTPITWLLSTSTIESQVEKNSASSLSGGSATKVFLSSSQKQTNATSYALIVMPRITIQQWLASCLPTSPLCLLISSEGISLVEYTSKDGREFGVLSVKAPTYADQLRVTCATVQAHLYAYSQNPFKLQQVTDTHARLCYSTQWTLEFAARWAPIHVANDPTNLNRNWLANAMSVYQKLIQEIVT